MCQRPHRPLLIFYKALEQDRQGHNIVIAVRAYLMISLYFVFRRVIFEDIFVYGNIESQKSQKRLILS